MKNGWRSTTSKWWKGSNVVNSMLNGLPDLMPRLLVMESRALGSILLGQVIWTDVSNI
jgi:hypothetical protein